MTDEHSSKRRKVNPPDPGAYVLKKVLDDIPLASEDGIDPVSITCVEFWSMSEQMRPLEVPLLSVGR